MIDKTANKSAGVDMDTVIKRVSELYKTERILGTAAILGGSIALLLALMAATPYLAMESHEFISLAALSSVLILAGCGLYGFLATLEYKTAIAAMIGNREAFEAMLRAQEEQKPDWIKTAGG